MDATVVAKQGGVTTRLLPFLDIGLALDRQLPLLGQGTESLHLVYVYQLT